jgi:hypothetical protein
LNFFFRIRIYHNQVKKDMLFFIFLFKKIGKNFVGRKQIYIYN